MNQQNDVMFLDELSKNLILSHNLRARLREVSERLHKLLHGPKPSGIPSQPTAQHESVQDAKYLALRLLEKIMLKQFGIEIRDKPLDTVIESFGLDSLDKIEFIMMLEDELKVEVSDESAEKHIGKVWTIGTSANLIGAYFWKAV